jgi:DNA polymerase I
MTREMVKYAARDIPLLFSVFRGQIEQLKKHDLIKVAQLEFDNIPVAAEMEVEGFYLDEVKLKWLITYWERRKEEMEEDILTKFNKRRKEMGQIAYIIPDWPEVFDLASNKGKRDALKKIGVSLDDVKRDTLLASGDEIAVLLAEYSHALKMTSTYGENMVKKINKFTGRCHPHFYQMGQGSGEDGRDTKETTATGRWAGDAQQYPRESDGVYANPLNEEEREAVEKFFAAEIAAADAKYAQQEEK